MYSFRKPYGALSRQAISLALGLTLLLWAAVAAAAAPAITADAAILVDAATGEVLYEKNADKREYPASLTKMMTCILALEQGRPDRVVRVSSNAANVESTYLKPGDRMRFGDLLAQMMLASDNGAATAIGESLAQGDIKKFAQRMNEEARSLGMERTHFVNANGMPDTNHYTTARDFSKLACYAMKNEQFRRLVGTKQRNIYYITPSGHKEFLENTNKLLHSYPGCTGIKTGWTRAAQGCLAVAAQRDGRELIAIVLHSQDGSTRFTEGAALLDYGFSKK